MNEKQSEIVELENKKIVLSIQPLTERKIRSQLIMDGFQDTDTLLPFALSISALIYMGLYAPVLGGFLIGLAVFILAGLTGLAVFLWRYALHYQQSYAMKSQELIDHFESENFNREEIRFKQAFIDLEKGFIEIKADDGLKVLKKLDFEFKQLQPLTTSGQELDLISLSTLNALARETYFQGLIVLDDALELERAIHSTNNLQLQFEIEALEKKVIQLKNDPMMAERQKLVEEKIDANKERLELVNKLKLRVDQLLHQASRCEASLGKTRIELAALKADASDVTVSAVTETLRRTIDRAKEVQQELKRMGY